MKTPQTHTRVEITENIFSLSIVYWPDGFTRVGDCVSLSQLCRLGDVRGTHDALFIYVVLIVLF